jgi:hypothetical protein
MSDFDGTLFLSGPGHRRSTSTVTTMTTTDAWLTAVALAAFAAAALIAFLPLAAHSAGF